MNAPAGTRFWLHTVPLEQVLEGQRGGFTQAGDGRETRLSAPGLGDPIAFYSSRTALPGGRVLQQFTAAGVVSDVEPYRVEVEPGVHRWRRRVDFEDVGPVPIRALLPMLGFVTDEQKWSLPFRRGLLEVTAGDFGVIAGALRDAFAVPLEYSASGRSARA